MINLSP